MPDHRAPGERWPAHRGMSGPAALVKLVLSWLVVGVPAAWGIYHVIVDAMKLFRT